jgi:hypothetical protein
MTIRFRIAHPSRARRTSSNIAHSPLRPGYPIPRPSKPSAKGAAISRGLRDAAHAPLDVEHRSNGSSREIEPIRPSGHSAGAVTFCLSSRGSSHAFRQRARIGAREQVSRDPARRPGRRDPFSVLGAAAAGADARADAARRHMAPRLPRAALAAAPAKCQLRRLRRAGAHRSARRQPFGCRAVRSGFRRALRSSLPHPPHELRRQVWARALPPRRRGRERELRMPAGGAIALRGWEGHGLLVRARVRRGGGPESAREPVRRLRSGPRPRHPPLLRPLAAPPRDGDCRRRAGISVHQLGLGRQLVRIDEGLHHFSATGHGTPACTSCPPTDWLSATQEVVEHETRISG